MAYDEGMAQIFRDDLAEWPGISEKKMFGGLCFLINGNMVCGVHKGGAMMRVGKDNEAAALDVPGTGPMMFTGKPMSGMIDVSADTVEDDALRGRLMAIASAFAASLPPK